MSRRKYRLRPPTSPGYKTGQVLTFTASGDAPQPSELVELTPASPVPTALEIRKEDDRPNGKPLPPTAESAPETPPVGEGT